MLSTIYSVAKEFEAEHGYSPNLVYMNYAHLECLKQQLEDPRDFNAILVFLGMELILEPNINSPYVGWAHAPWKEAVYV
ncbi:MAG: hypothetical protein OEZ68_13840 [Gammaproteobacteria bacterium]|nr:hypothetical protein [Gammaproteobacteria bacterium]MDH5801884.1 hypothetical protein [Gammaproteobacteria bacterium]